MNNQRHKVLIIKLGYCETLLPVVRQACSLGDVFRTTQILHLFKDAHVTWLTDAAALPLLEGNPYIHRLLTFDLLSTLQLLGERFDKVINLEKVPGICALVNRINAWSKYGFRFDEDSGEPEAYERAHEALAVATVEDAKKFNDKSWAEVIYRVLGATYQGQGYVLGYQPRSQITHDIGFNVNVGRLMPEKAWPQEHWSQLEKLLEGRYSVSWQQHLDDLRGYMDWIHSCRMLVTCDTLGLYLAVAMGRKALAMFGPTTTTEQSPHPRLRTLVSPSGCSHKPCMDVRCRTGDSCMKYLTPEQVARAVIEWGLD